MTIVAAVPFSTEEAQSGLAARALAPILRRALHHHHPRWLAGLARAAAQGNRDDAFARKGSPS